MFFEGKVVRVLVQFFFTAAHFHLALVATSISPFVTTTTKFSCCYAPINVNPVGGSAGKGWGFDKF